LSQDKDSLLSARLRFLEDGPPNETFPLFTAYPGPRRVQLGGKAVFVEVLEPGAARVEHLEQVAMDVAPPDSHAALTHVTKGRERG
jgi:hypothetical protein